MAEEKSKRGRGRPKGRKNNATLKREKKDNTEFQDDEGTKKRWWKARATKCTAELTDAICENLSIGMYLSEACKAEGLSPSTMMSWKNKADADEANGDMDSPFIAFRDAVEMAHAQAERDLMREIRHAHTNQTNFANLAWILERTRNQRFGQRQEVTQTVNNVPPQLPPDPPKDYNEWLERRKKRMQINVMGEGIREGNEGQGREAEGERQEVGNGKGSENNGVSEGDR